MRIEEAIVFLLVERNGGMTAEQIAAAINDRRLHIRKDGQSVSVRQIWWAVNHFKSMFAFTQGRIYLLIWPSVLRSYETSDEKVIREVEALRRESKEFMVFGKCQGTPLDTISPNGEGMGLQLPPEHLT